MSFRILIVDDNSDIHKDFKKILSKRELSKEIDQIQKIKSQLLNESLPEVTDPSYEIDSAYQGLEALKMVKESLQVNRPYALIFLDVLMPPGISGIETAKEIWKLDPHVQIVICTAYANYSWDAIVKELGINDKFLILKKPFDSIEIRQMAACLTEKWRLNH